MTRLADTTRIAIGSKPGCPHLTMLPAKLQAKQDLRQTRAGAGHARPGD